jgi:translation initiation factor 3 subunit H
MAKHEKQHGCTANGQLLGVEMDGVLDITDSFALPSRIESETEESNDEVLDAFQYQTLEGLREVNIDYRIMGWYSVSPTSASLSLGTLETMLGYQTMADTMNAVFVAYDPTMSIRNRPSVRAFRLSQKFLELKNFTHDE